MSAPDITTAPDVVATDGDDSDDLNHFWCCDPDVAYCGADLSGAIDDEDFDEDAEDMCVVCFDLQFAICACEVSR